MKECTKMSRLTNQLEKLYSMLNRDIFNNELEPVIITVSPTAHAYGHYTTGEVWSVKDTGKREINIASATLIRQNGIEGVVATMVHEMCHHYDYTVLKKPDCTNGYYHSTVFRDTALSHGLTCEKVGRYGWTHTECNDELLMWILENDIPDIKLCRAQEFSGSRPTGTAGGTTGTGTTTTKPKSNSRRYVCPKCKAIARTTREIKLICGDCMEVMVYTGN